MKNQSVATQFPLPVIENFPSLSLEGRNYMTDLKNILHRISDGFFAVDNDWIITYANPQAEAILDVKREDYIGKNIWECFPEMKGTIYSEMYEMAMRDKAAVTFEGYHPRFMKWYEVNAYPSDTGLSVLFRDISQQKQLTEEKLKWEQKLQEQNEMMVEVLEQMSSGFITVRYDGKIMYWNKKAEEISGIPRDMILGKSLWEVYPNFKTSVYYGLYNTLIKEKVPLNTEVLSPFSQRWVEIHAYTTQKGISVFFNDTTLEKQIEEEVDRLSHIVRKTRNAVSIIDTEGRIIWINEAFSRITGYTEADALGKRNGELLLGAESDLSSIQKLEKAIQNCKPFKAENIIYKKDGKKIWVEYSGQTLLDCKGELDQYFIILNDISDRKHAELELHKLSLIVEQTVNAVVISDEGRNILWANKACFDLSGYGREEVVGKKIWEVFDGPQTDPEIIRFTQECVQRLQPFRVEVLNYRKDGSTYWADVSCQPLFEKNGKFQCFFSIATDITARKNLEQKLEEERKKNNAAIIAAQEKERALVGQELHDNVNQVLTTVKLYTEICRDGIGNSEELLDKSMQLLQGSIDEIRSLSKRLSAPTLGQIRLKESIIDLIDAVSATNRLRFEFDLEGIAEVEVGQDVHLGIYRILQEHLTNVLKHAQAEMVTIMMCVRRHQLVLEVKDDGIGFDRRQPSRGIGIANMISRCETLKGRLVLNSAPGHGCELKVSLPLR